MPIVEPSLLNDSTSPLVKPALMLTVADDSVALSTSDSTIHGLSVTAGACSV